MEQLTQNLKNGHMQILEVPFPVLNSGCILVRNHYSLISAGTEGKTVKDARLGYIGKAIARKDEVKKVVKSVKTIGLKDTYKLTMNKLDAPSALGYSCAGEVIAVASDVSEFKIGDKVACAGGTAVHAEVVCVPKNLCTPVPDPLGMDQAAFATLGAIAMQGFRQSDLKLGESCVVIGLGLVGQLTLQILNAAGVKAIGIDLNEEVIKRTRSLGFKNIFHRNEPALEDSVKELGNGYGADAVIITASSSDTDPVDLAGEICRAKGKVVMVGNVPAGFERKNYYRKELELKMSCSYGPGRYDRNYEEHGSDYPYAYVRWTENRNMQAFLELVAVNKVDVASCISHVFDFSDAPKAYDLILEGSEIYSGILLKYDTGKKISRAVQLKNTTATKGKVNAALIGAGSFAGNIFLPALKGKCVLTSIVSNKPNQAKNLAEKFGFSSCAASVDEILHDKSTNTVFICTRHDSHAKYVIDSLKAGKNVFVEKPLCLTEEELNEIVKVYSEQNNILMTGFNRRFSPVILKAKKHFENVRSPLSIHYRINSGILPKDHWTNDPAVGGGRILGELCHFIDLAAFICGSKVRSVSAVSVNDSNHLNDTLSVNLGFDNGSIASISYFSNGSRELEKEYLEIFGGGQVVSMNDFSELKVYGKTVKTESSGKQDKGHKNELAAFIEAIETGKTSPIPFEGIHNTTLATIKTLESVMNGGKQIML